MNQPLQKGYWEHSIYNCCFEIWWKIHGPPDNLEGILGKYMGMSELSRTKLVKNLQMTEKQQQTHQMKHGTDLRWGNSHGQPWPY